MLKKWKILSNVKVSNTEDVIHELLKNRDINEKNINDYLNPDIDQVTLLNAGIDKKEYAKFKKRIDKAIKKKEKIIVFGDYDVDGICASAILWETLFTKTKNVIPYIPSRADEGYGLSKKGIDNVLISHPDVKLIITVDNGIVAFDAVDYANEKGIDVVITDHHVKSDKIPNSICLIHTTTLCGAGIAWIISRELNFETKSKIQEKLELAMLATIADLVPLIGLNRVIVKEGLELIKKTKRVGLKELFLEAGIDIESLSVYTVGHVIAPRLNASGRITHAIDALRLLCTKNKDKAREFAQKLNLVNLDRQGLTTESVAHAKLLALENSYSNKVVVVAHESYNQGVIGLVASQLVENYYRPAFAIAKGEDISKGSARSISGVNIIELLRSVSDTLLEVGGHPMAAGFSVKTSRIEEFAKTLAVKAEEVVTEEVLERYINIDLMLPFGLIEKKLWEALKPLAPFGMKNPEPVFATESVNVLECRKIGRDLSHLKFKLEKDGKIFDAVAFSMASICDVSEGETINIAYTIDENVWNGKVSLQLKIRDIKSN